MESDNHAFSASAPESSIDRQIKLHEEFVGQQSYLGRLTSKFTGNGDEELSRLKDLKAHGGVFSGPNGAAEVLKAIQDDRDRLEKNGRIDGYVSTFARSAAMFLPGKSGYVVSAAVGALDTARPDESVASQALDVSLGAAEGTAMKGAASWLSRSELPIALNGVLLGTTSRALHTGLDRRTWTDQYGKFSLDGAARTWAITADKNAIAGDIVSFSAGMAATGALGKLSDGALAASIPLSRIVTGATFGASSGMTAEIAREHNFQSQLDWRQIAQEGAIQALIGAAAAGPGGVLEARQSQMSTPEYFLSRGNYTAKDRTESSAKELGDSWDHGLNEGTIKLGNRQSEVVVREFKQGSGSEVPFKLSQAAYKLNQLVGLDDNIPAAASRMLEENGQAKRVWVQEKIQGASDKPEHGVKDLNFVLGEKLSGQTKIADLLEANPNFEQQLQKIIALRMVAQDTDMQAFQILVKPHPEAPSDLNQAKLYHLDFDTWFVPGTTHAEWSPNTLFGGMNDVAEYYAGKPVSEQVRQKISRFAEKYDNAKGRNLLQQELDLTPDQVDGLLARSRSFVKEGQYPGYLGIAQEADYTRTFGSMQVQGLMRGKPPTIEDLNSALNAKANNEAYFIGSIADYAKAEPNKAVAQPVKDRIERLNTLPPGAERTSELINLIADKIALVKRGVIRENEANYEAAKAKVKAAAQ